MLFAQKKGLQAHKKLNVNPMQKNKSVFLFVMLFIPMLHWAIFWLYVNSSSIFLAFQTRQGGWTLDNFTVFFDSLTRAGQDMNIAVKNTLLYFGVNVLICLPSSYIVAYFIYKKIAAYPVFRVIFYLPGIVSSIVLTMVFKQFIMPDGPLDVLLQKMFGVALPRAGLLGQSSTATNTILVYCIWTGLSGSFMVLGGSMARIPTELIESAKLEGCKPFREIISIVFPLTWPTFSTLLIVSMTGLFTSSGPMLTLVDGNFETWTISYWIFYKVNGSVTGGVPGGYYNLVSAAGLFFTLLTVPIILFVRWIIEKKIPSVEY